MKKKDLVVGKTYLWKPDSRSGKIVTLQATTRDFGKQAELARLGYQRAGYPAMGDHTPLVTYEEAGRDGTRQVYNFVTLGSLKEEITPEEYAARQERDRLARIARDEVRENRQKELDELADALNEKLGDRFFDTGSYPTPYMLVRHSPGIEDLVRLLLERL